MLSIAILFTSLLAGFAVAQNSTQGLDPNSVDLTTRNQWCQGEQHNCPTLCGGQGFTTMNTCSGQDLSYTCTCSNGTSPASIAQYLNTLPNSICYQIYTNCVKANPNSSQQCIKCGQLQPSDVPASTSSASSTTMSATAAASTASAVPTGKGASPNTAGKIENGIGGVAAGVIAAAALVL